jgi:RHH-type transcriptional regulator, rel operon repressor / antitoxin RelB
VQTVSEAEAVVCCAQKSTGSCMSSSSLSIRVSDAAKERLSALAKSTGRTSSFLAAEAIEAYLDLNEWQVRGIRAGMLSLDAGRGATHQDVKTWAASLGAADELPSPGKPRDSVP